MTAVRKGMRDLILTLRGMTNAGTADYTIGLTTYWNDGHLQDTLDRYCTVVRDEEITPFAALNSGGSISYYDYQSRNRFFESTSEGTARFVIRDSTGTVKASTDWSADYERGLITFTTDTAGAAYLLSGYSYDVYAAASDVWYQKAAHAGEMIDFSTDNHNIKRSHIVATALKMARRYENMSSTTIYSSAVVERGDYQ